MREEKTVVKMDERGRIQIPAPIREALGAKGTVLVRVSLSIVKNPEGEDDQGEQAEPALA